MADSFFYIYILFSPTSNKYYVGYSRDPFRRVIEHNTKPFNTYTSKHRPWILKAVFKCGKIETDALRLERFIKKQKSRKLLEQLCEVRFILICNQRSYAVSLLAPCEKSHEPIFSAST